MRTFIKIFITISLAFLIQVVGFAQDENFFEAGSKAYSEANYPLAIEQFKQGLQTAKTPTAELYYNLGCAYFKNGDIAQSILNFERAYRIAPSDGDIKFNLKMANNQIVDKMDPLPKLFLARWADSASHWFSLLGWNLVNVIIFTVFAVGMFYFLRGKSLAFRKGSFIVSMVFLLLFIFAQIFAWRLYGFMSEQKEGILMSEVVTVKSSPDHSAKDLVVVHSGLKVIRLQELGGFSEVKLPDGTIGWIPNSSYEIINNFEK